MKYILVIIFFLVSSGSFAANLDLDAKEIVFEKQDNIVATGDVGAIYLNHNLNAQYLRYDKKLGYMVAKDNVVYFDNESKFKLLADEIDSNEDYSIFNGRNIYAFLPGDSHLQAKELKRDNDILMIRSGNYSACEICKDGKKKIPTWQIYAKKITYNQKSENIYFKHAFFKIYNVPVFYLPVFWHASPKVKKRSGILAPRYTKDSLLGNMVSTPVFVNLSPNYDLTYTPSFYTKNNVLHEGEVRHMNKYGNLELAGGSVRENNALKERLSAEGIDVASEDSKKWFLDMEYLFNKGNYGLEADVFDVSDKAFLERYQDDYRQYYSSDSNVNYVSEDSQFVFNVANFYDVENNDKTYELPHMSYQKLTKFKHKIFYKSDLDYVYLNADDDVHRSRMFYNDRLYKDFQTKGGLLFDMGVRNMLRIYANDNDDQNLHDQPYTHYSALLDANISKPYVKYGKDRRYLITPKVAAIFAPDTVNSNRISNIDSATVFLNSNNIMTAKKNSGVDLLEEGSRFSYGLTKAFYGKQAVMENFIGQAFYARTQEDISRSSGIKKDFSDIVGKFSFAYGNKVDFSYEYKLKEEDFRLYHSQLDLGVDAGNFSLDTSYTKYRYNILDASSAPLEQVISTVSYDNKDLFKISAGMTRNMLSKDEDENAGTIQSNIGLELYGSCVTYLAGLQKDYIVTGNNSSNLTVLFGIKIKGLD